MLASKQLHFILFYYTLFITVLSFVIGKTITSSQVLNNKIT